MADTIPLTEHLHVTSGAHIVYFYDERDCYIANAISFIRTGFEQNQHVIYVDSLERYGVVKDALEREYDGKTLETLKFIPNDDFYMMSVVFHMDHVFRNFKDAVQPFLDKHLPVRVWGHVDWGTQDDLLDRLYAYECHCDEAIAKYGVLTVCAYEAERVSAKIQNRMLRTHEYMMTDSELTLSNLYSRTDKTVIFPSFSVHREFQNEMNMYKEKLDFVQAVSHEVRNPLTVIKAYASLLIRNPSNPAAKKMLTDIQDYVTVIDHEIAHIINTEEMLTSEALWKKNVISPSDVIEEVFQMMMAKARTQSIHLHRSIRLDRDVRLFGNVIGLRLIISNLLSNAIKYSEAGSDVGMHIEMEEDVLTIRIEDNGIGMSDEQLGKLFQKYEKMNTEQSGQGVGLFMVKKLVDHFEGRIRMKSLPNVGTEAIVQLPVWRSS